MNLDRRTIMTLSAFIGYAPEYKTGGLRMESKSAEACFSWFE